MEQVSEFLNLFNAENIMGLLLFILIATSLLFIIKLHFNKDDDINLEDLVKTKRKIDGDKLFRVGAWVVSTWGFVYLLVLGKLTEWYFVGYIGVWVSNAIFDKYFNSKQDEEDDRRYDPYITRSRVDYGKDERYRYRDPDSN